MNNAMPHDPDEMVTDIELERDVDSAEKRVSSREQPSSSLAGTLEYRNQTVPVRISDLSMGGVGVTTEAGLPIGQDCKLVIQLSVCGADYELQIRSRILHCEPVTSRAHHAGLKFVDMSESTRATLRLLVR